MDGSLTGPQLGVSTLYEALAEEGHERPGIPSLVL